MKKTTMKALTAAAAALLIAAVFVGAGAADTETATLYVDSDASLDANNIWPMPQLAGEYWTNNDTVATIPILINNTGVLTNLYAYNLTFAGNMTESLVTAPSEENLKNAVPDWDVSGSFTHNIWKVAKGADVPNAGDKGLNLSNAGGRIFNVTLTTTNLSGKYDVVYNISATGYVGVTDKTFAAVTVDDVKAIPVDSTKFPKDSKFILHIRGSSTETVPNVTAYVIGNFPKNEYYPSLNADGTAFFYFVERLDGVSQVINLSAITTPAYDNSYDTNDWKLTQGTNALTDLGKVSVLADNLGRLNNTAKVSATPDLSTTVEVVLNNNTKNKNVTSFTFYTKKWLIENSTNDQTRASTKATGNGQWNFETPLNRTYLVSAGPVNVDETTNGWDTHVKFTNMTHGNLTAAWNASVVYYNQGETTPITTYYLNKSNDNGGYIWSNVNFSVTTNDIADITKNVTIVFTGHKLGDANMDENVNIADSAVVGITVLKNEISTVGTFLPAENRIYADCDVSADGDIDVNDILAINNYIVGNDPWGTAPA